MRDQSDRYIVNDLIPGGPAERDGLHVGDIIRQVDGIDASTFEDVAQLAAVVRGEEGDSCYSCRFPFFDERRIDD